MSVIVGADGATRGMGTPDWTVPVMICVETCVFPLLGMEGEDWFQEVQARPYQGLHFDVMSPKIAKKLGLKV